MALFLIALSGAFAGLLVPSEEREGGTCSRPQRVASRAIHGPLFPAREKFTC
jgi:hypothetical protein